MDLEVFGVGTGNTRGPCPFSQSVFMALEERKMSYRATYIEENTSNQPDWFLQHNPSGVLPALKDHGAWICDSNKNLACAKIFEYLVEKFPEQSEPLTVPSDLKPQIEQISTSLFDTFTSWLESRNKFAQAGADYAKAVEALNTYLQGKHLYMAGSHVTDADCELFPKLRYARVTLLQLMDFEIPLELAAVHRYIELMENRESVRRTDCRDMQIVQHYQTKYDLQVAYEQPA